MQTVSFALVCLAWACNASRVQGGTRGKGAVYKLHRKSQKADDFPCSSHSLAEVGQSPAEGDFHPMKALARILMASSDMGESEKTELSWQIKNTPLIYINLVRRPDRRQRMEEQLAKHGLEATRYEALIGTSVADTVIGDSWQPGMHANFDIRQKADSWHVFSDGERGCAGSHVTLWQFCVKENLPIIVLEDDAVFDEDFLVKLQQSMRHVADHDPTLLYFQATVAEWGSYRKAITPDLEIRAVKYASEAAAYAIWPQTASILLGNLPMREPLDSFLARLSHDGQIRTYACSPPIIHQFDLTGDSDVPRTGVMSDDEFREKMRRRMKLDEAPQVPEAMRERTEKSMEPEVSESKAPEVPQGSTEQADSSKRAPMSAEAMREMLKRLRDEGVARESDEKKDQGATIVYINLAMRPDRRKRIEQQFGQHGVNAERFEAVTGAETSDAIIDRDWQPGLNAKFDFRQKEDEWHTLSDGERGCAGSHALLWKRCVAENRPMVIIEDDAVLSSDFENKLRQAMRHISEHDPSFLYLQSNVAEWGDYSEVISSNLQIRSVNYVWETGGYVVWPETAAILLENLPMHQPVDDYLAKMAYTGLIHQYACYPAVIRQYDQMGDSDISHTGVMSQEDFQEKMLYLMKNGLPPFN